MNTHLDRLLDGAFILVGITVIAVIIRAIVSQPTPPPSVIVLFALALGAAYTIGYGMEVAND